MYLLVEYVKHIALNLNSFCLFKLQVSWDFQGMKDALSSPNYLKMLL